LYRFSFHDGSYQVKRERPFYLKANENIAAFNAGMHQLDVQRIDATHYYYVYDGNRLKSTTKHLNIIGPLKMSYLDLKNWILQK
jgi:hypothetical protein